MTLRMSGALAVALWLCVPPAVADEAGGMWTLVSAAAPEADTAAAAVEQAPIVEWKLDRAGLDRFLRRLPAARFRSGDRPAVRERFPLPLGRDQEIFLVEETPVLAPELARRHPGLRTLAGNSETSPERRVRITVTPERLHARVFLPEGAVVVSASDGRYLAGPEAALRERLPSAAAACTAGPGPPGRTEALLEALEVIGPEAKEPILIADLRTYRLAVATTSAFARANGGTLESVLGVIATAVNSLNEVYERDLGVRLQLVPETERVIFTDPRDEPFTAETGVELLDESQAVLDCLVGAANYDVGHTLNAIGQSLADVGVGWDGRKGRGTTGIQIPVGEVVPGGNAFDLEYLGHELGHQFGAGHTYTGTLGQCDPKYFQTDSAVEPGSGSTLLSYAGLCDGDDIENHSGPYFHAVSIEQIVDYRGCPAADCQPTPAPTGPPPDVEAGPDVAIPCGTDFLLEPERFPAGDGATFTWEQVDAAPAPIPKGTGCCAAQYRSMPPSLMPAQRNPGLACGCGDQLCDLRFAFTARGHGSPGSGLAIDQKVVTVRRKAGPFRVTAPRQGSRHMGALEVRWDVKGTRELLGVDDVEIRLLCAGNAMSSVPVQKTENDGEATLAIPADVECAQAELEVWAVGSIFFARSGIFRFEKAAPSPSATGR
jgi:hypothetical protein